MAPNIEENADMAFRAFAVLANAEKSEPSLRDNPHWMELRKHAFARFEKAFSACGII